MGGVAALGDGAVPVDAAVGLGVAFQAVLLLPGAAVVALAAGVDDRADTDAVADGVLGHVGADLGDGAGDFVTDDLRVGDRAPVAADGVDVGVADAGVGDLDQDVRRSDITAGDGGRHQGVGRGGGRVGIDGQHRGVPSWKVVLEVHRLGEDPEGVSAGVHRPEPVGEDVGVMGGVAGGDAAGDDQLPDVDVLLGQGGVQHGGVGALAGEGDGGAGNLRVRSGAAAAVDEQHRSSTQGAHAGQDLADGGEGTVDGELHGAGEVGDGGVEDRVHELGLRDGAVLKDLDRAEVVGGPFQRTVSASGSRTLAA